MDSMNSADSSRILTAPQWNSGRGSGNLLFLAQNLVLKDFRIRYRNMSLGVLWSIANPLVMMAVLTFVFTRIYPNPAVGNFAVFILCGLVPFNFYSLALNAGTTSLLDNQSLVKRVRCPRRVFPVAAVLANCLHFLIQIGLLFAFIFIFGYRVNRYWPLLGLIWGLEVMFMSGLALITSALDIYYRDVRYLVEASSVVMFWLVPIFYSLQMVPERYRPIYLLNPIAAVVVAGRNVLLQAQAPPAGVMVPLVVVSFGCLALGLTVFGRLERDLADYL
jgi:homopolymeric O-antigen transport system permease protein